MGRDRGRSRRSSSRQGDSETRSSRSVSYTGAASWPIVEWSIKNELSQLGLPGSIVEHNIQRPAPLPSAAATAAVPTTPTSVTAPPRARASVPDEAEGKAGDATGPVDISCMITCVENCCTDSTIIMCFIMMASIWSAISLLPCLRI